MACNPDRFIERVQADPNLDRAYCRCCGRRIAYRMGDDGTPDGYCRWCELGHPPRVRVGRPTLFAAESAAGLAPSRRATRGEVRKASRWL